MGLDIVASFNCECEPNEDGEPCGCDVPLFRGSYTSFSQFREALAKLFPEGAPFALQMRFLDHSDCDGNWSFEECQELLNFFEKDVTPRVDEDWEDFYRVEMMVDGLRLCVENKSGAAFC